MVAAASVLSAAAVAEASVCTGVAPASGGEVRGPVLHVADATRVCVATGADPADWIEVRLADLPRGESWARQGRGALMAAAFAENVTCTVLRPARGEVRAICRLDGVSIARRAQRPDIVAAGKAWR
ncbi:hypothetical protein LRS10_00470 [Phenylobacterium sp. J426]|uniref:hypothetical protein n=1 Tax=Phenylobacterium sp. J426 TaxID=2898439 RepID=UPI002150E8BA|nr:hypothetical protein [Phenylobacterium sp. J426]MCR5872796.1 hypothetical protein [Phenylobacterium sp. J426]